MFFLAGQEGLKTIQRLMSEGQMITIALCISMYLGADKGPNKYGLQVALVQGVRPFSVKISGLVCVVSHLILLSTKNSKVFSCNFGPPSDLLVLPLIYCWPKAELTTDHRPYRKHWQEMSELFMPKGLCMKPWANLNLKLFASTDPHHDAVILKLYWGFKSLM